MRTNISGAFSGDKRPTKPMSRCVAEMPSDIVKIMGSSYIGEAVAIHAIADQMNPLFG